ASRSTRSVYDSIPAIVAKTPRSPSIRSASPYGRPSGQRSTSRPAASSWSRYSDRRFARSDGTTRTLSDEGIQGLLTQSWMGSWNGHGRRHGGSDGGSWLVAPQDASSLELVARQGPGGDRGHLDADPQVAPDGLCDAKECFPLAGAGPHAAVDLEE